MRPLAVWHTTQSNSVSLQLSTQKGIQQHIPVNIKRPKHQIQVTAPGNFFGKFWVSLLQQGQTRPIPGTKPPLFAGINPWLGLYGWFTAYPWLGGGAYNPGLPLKFPGW
jgi:hypothetical protein